MATPSVEVKCIETFAFYPAFLRDYNAATGQVLVAYPNAWKKDEWVKIEDVRNAPPQFDPTTFAPQAGDIVEAQAKSSDDEPYSFWKATVKTVRGEFYMISYSSWEDEFNEILEKDMLRPFNTNPPLRANDIKKLELALPKDLSASLDVRALNKVLETSGALSVHIDAHKQVLVILGTQASTKRAQLLAGMAFKHLVEIQKLTERKQKHQQHLDSLKQRLNEGHLETFSIDPPDLTGLIIGQKGSNIKRVERMPGILNVRVDSSKNQVSILANSEAEAKAAREQLEFVSEHYPILRRQVGRVVGKAFSNMDQIQKDSGVVRIRLATETPATKDSETVDLVIIGTKDTVADALLLLTHHMEFLQTVNQLSQDERELNDEVRKMNIEAGLQEREQQYRGGVRTGGPRAGGFGGRGGRGPQPQGDRQYAGGNQDFPPLQGGAPRVQAKPAAAATTAPVATGAAPAGDAADERKDGRGGRGARGGRGGRSGSQSGEQRQQGQAQQQQPAGEQPAAAAQPSTSRQPRQPKQAAASAPAAASGSPVAASDAAAAPAGGEKRGRGRKDQKPKESTPASEVAAGTPAAAAAPAAAGAAQPQAERKPKQERKRAEARPAKSFPSGGAASSPAAPADGASPTPAAASPAGDAAAAGSSPKPRGQRRERQPAGDASASPPAANAPAAASPQ